MGIWEYLVIVLSHMKDVDLNDLGSKGWELLTVYEQQNQSGVSGVFKRPK